MDPLIIDPLVIDSNIEITTDLPLNHRKKKRLGKVPPLVLAQIADVLRLLVSDLRKSPAPFGFSSSSPKSPTK
jgi:hypothetical protein